MPIPFRDLTGDDELGLAAYLCVVDEPEGQGLRAALLLVTARGEPVEFTFSRVDTPTSFLWRPEETRRKAVTALARSLFAACQQTPTLLLVRADEVPPPVFTEDLEVQLPTCRVADAAEPGPREASAPRPRSLEQHTPDLESRSAASPPSPGQLDAAPPEYQLLWIGAPPPPDSSARRLLEALQSRHLLTEPFDRTAQGLDEAFHEP